MRSIIPLFAAASLASAPIFAGEFVPLQNFRSVELHGGGIVEVGPGPEQRVMIIEGSSAITRMSVDTEGKLSIDVCQLRCPPNYRLRILIRSPRVPNLAIDGGGVMTTATGFAPQDHLAAAVNGGGHIDARTVDASTVSAAVNGGGEILVRPRGSLLAAVNGGGHVRYWGNPATRVAIRGGGAVSPGY